MPAAEPKPAAGKLPIWLLTLPAILFLVAAVLSLFGSRPERAFLWFGLAAFWAVFAFVLWSRRRKP